MSMLTNERFTRITLQKTTSTNDEAKLCFKEHPEIKECLITTEFQTAGRGQKGNHWESEAEKNLLFSIGVSPAFLPPRLQFKLLQAESLAIAETLDAYTNHIYIKWPNDIYYKEKKLSGTLIENQISHGLLDHCILGTGINVNQTGFTDYPSNPTSLIQIIGHETEREELLQQIVYRFATWYDRLAQGESEELDKRYAERMLWCEGIHTYRDSQGMFEAHAEGVEADGQLRLRDTEGRLRLYSFKEVKHVFQSLESF